MNPVINNATQKAKQLLSTNNYPTHFNPELWEAIFERTNCYAYALNSYLADPLPGNTIYYPGAFSGEDILYYYHNIVFFNRFKSDIKNLGFILLKSTLEDTLKKDEHKILVSIRNDNCDYHFMRQDSDGFWSHKRGWFEMPTNLKSNGYKILNPEEELLDHTTIGYFKIKKNNKR